MQNFTVKAQPREKKQERSEVSQRIRRQLELIRLNKSAKLIRLQQREQSNALAHRLLTDAEAEQPPESPEEQPQLSECSPERPPLIAQFLVESPPVQRHFQVTRLRELRTST